MNDLSPTPSRWRSLDTIGPLLGLVFVILLFGGWAPAEFRTLYNAKTVLTQTVIVGIGALGMTIIIVAGGIDLSVGSLVALCTVAVAATMKNAGVAETGMWLPLFAAGVGVFVCTLCGLINGILVARAGIVPFIVTLGMMQIARGLAKWIGHQQTIVPPPNWLNRLMEVEPVRDAWYSVAPGVWLLLLLLATVHLVLTYTVFGRYVFAIGSNADTARLCGIPVDRIRVAVYALAALLTGVAGVMQYANLNLGDPTAAGGMELDMIAAVVIGGGSLSGGKGSALGSILGALIMATLRNGCNMVGLPSYVQNIIIGAVIVAAAGADVLRRRNGTAA